MSAFSLDHYLHDLKTLAEIESHTAHPDGVNAVADFFEERFRAAGWTVTRSRPGGAFCGDVLDMRNCNAGEASILMLGHMDTVYPPGTLSTFPFRIEDRRVRGPGVADMKGGLLFILELARRFQNSGIPLAAVFNSDEEISSPWSGPLIRARAKECRHTLVFEPGRPDGALVVQRKGVAVYQIDFTGKAAHAGVAPETGVSAVSELARWILELDRLTDYAAGTSLNMGLVSGGEAKNAIPASAHGTLDVRFTDPAVPARIEQRMQDLSATARPGLSNHWKQTGFRPPMNPGESTPALCSTVLEIAQRIGLPGISFMQTGGASDGNLAAAEGSICLDAMGPCGGGLHSPDEYLLLDSVEPRICLACELILYLGRQKGRQRIE